MPIVIPKNSFVKPVAFDFQLCVPRVDLCLPVYDLNDISFQILDIGNDYHDYAVQIAVNGVGVGDSVALPFYPTAINGTFTNVVIMPGLIDTYFNELENGDCFTIQIIGCDKRNVCAPIFISNCFIKITDQCWTSDISYSCDENSFGFQYFIDDGAGGNLLAGFKNKIRLPLYVSEPQFPVTRNVFIKSNGERKKLSARVSTQYEGFTDYMPKDWHEKLVIAMEHDYLTITNINSGFTNQTFSQEGSYEIDWQHFLDYPNAPAKFKLLRTPYQNVNSNCR